MAFLSFRLRYCFMRYFSRAPAYELYLLRYFAERYSKERRDDEICLLRREARNDMLQKRR